MSLANYISDLLYRYDCVIVPNFGGFITNKISATLNENTHVFHPPTKQVGFNANLKHNDGLLANYVASAENISFEKANSFIDKEVFIWLSNLESDIIDIAPIGQMSLNSEKQIVFEPNNGINFLTQSFGLYSVQGSVKEEYKERVIPIHTATAGIEEGEVEKKGISTITKVAAAAAILLIFGLGYQQYDKKSKQKNILAEQQKDVEKKIQEATFVIENPLPTINLNIAKVSLAKEFHVIAGAFQLMKNAEKKIEQLKKKGFDAVVLGENKWGLTQVAFESYQTEKEARLTLQNVKQSGYKDAWLLVEKFE